MIYYKIFHETIFNYNAPVSFSHNIARLKPAHNDVQKLLEYRLELHPKSLWIDEYEDYFGNQANKIFIKQTHYKLEVVAHSIVSVDEESIVQKIKATKEMRLTAQELHQNLTIVNETTLYAKQFLFTSELISYPSQEILEYAAKSFRKYKNIFWAVCSLTRRIFKDFEFQSGFSTISTPIEIIFREKKGVCQDFASLMIAILRAYHIPARYVSGYIQTNPPQGQEKLFGVDASHAWVSAYFGKFGWIDFDPTNNKIPNEEYVLLGYGRDYNDITPLKGVVQGSGTSYLSVRVDMRRVELDKLQ